MAHLLNAATLCILGCEPSIALNWLSLYPNSYFVLFVCNVCMTFIMFEQHSK